MSSYPVIVEGRKRMIILQISAQLLSTMAVTRWTWGDSFWHGRITSSQLCYCMKDTMSLWTDRHLSKSLTRAITTCDLRSAMFFLHTFCWYETGMIRVRKTKELSTNTTRCHVAACVLIAVSTLHNGSWITTTHSFTTLSSLWNDAPPDHPSQHPSKTFAARMFYLDNNYLGRMTAGELKVHNCAGGIQLVMTSWERIYEHRYPR
jgi:hypothetical protein